MMFATASRAGRLVRIGALHDRTTTMRPTATTLELGGVVASGLGEGTYFTQIDWVVAEFREKLGFVPHPGTFNLGVAGARWTAARRRLLAAGGVAITPPGGFCGARCFPVRVGGRLAGAIVLPELHDYPHDKIEIVAPVRLREALGVENGDRVLLRVDIGGSPLASHAPLRDIPPLTRGDRP